ncbi:NADP-dependent oxidoreductase domain-containing protein [Mycena polygramma]|nr:NADP-dependent oxidoreductase domain-containing protein [Mycena polygramma]
MSQTEYPAFETKGMPFRRLGPSGLRVPLLSLGGCTPSELIRTAFENGINTFDTAETYAEGKSEVELGRVIKELGYKRSDLECLERLQMTYVDVLFAHRCDRTVTMEEIVRAFNYVIRKGWALYWGTSAWSAQQIEEAHHIATKLDLIPPIAEQMLHNMFYRERPEKEYASLYEKYGYGTTIWSPLSGGILTGKYSDGIPEGSRFASESKRQMVVSPEVVAQIDQVRHLTALAQSLDSTPTALALAWLAKNPNTSTIILGVSSPGQLSQNLAAMELLPRITDEHLARIEEILGNRPDGFPTYGRPALDLHGRH